MAIANEQPPENTNPMLSEYLTRLFRQAREEDENKDQRALYTSMPLRLSVGKEYYFKNAIAADPDITAEGLYIYKSTGWVFLG